jgi:6-phosphofructokinase 1
MCRIGILTGGGPASGHNAVIYAALLEAQKRGIELIAIWQGWKGLIQDSLVSAARPLSIGDVNPYRYEGGTILMTSRENPYKKENVEKGLPRIVWENIQKLSLDGLLTLGGDDTNSVSFNLQQEHPDFPIIGLPKTMDNDLNLPQGVFHIWI